MHGPNGYYYCANCSHKWQWEESQDVTALRFCTRQCQVCYYTLGAREKLGDSQMDDIMQIRVPKAKIIWGKGLKEEAKKENDALKRKVTAHWTAIYSEFIEYYDEFVSVQMAVKLGAQFEEASTQKPQSQTKAQLAIRSRRRLLGGLDTYPRIHALVQEREQLDAVFRPGGKLVLLNRSNVVGQEDLPKVERQMRLLKENTMALDRVLAENVEGYEDARDRFLLLMQSLDFRQGLGQELYMKPWTEEITRLDGEVRTGQQDSTQNRLHLKNRLIIAYKLAKYHKKLAPIMSRMEPVRAEVYRMHRHLVELLDSGSLEFEATIRDYLRQLQELVKEYPSKKEKSSKKKDKKKDEKEKSGKLKKIPKEKTKTRKEDRPKDVPIEESDEEEEDMNVIEPTINNTNDVMPTLTADEAMQVEPPRYTNDELAERTHATAQWHRHAQQSTMSPARKEIIQNLHNYYADLRNQGHY